MSRRTDVVVRGGTLVTPDAVAQADIAIRDGKILGVGTSARSSAGEVVDATGLHVFAGFVDGHVHLRDPGAPESEDFATGTAAAALGGVTTVVDMPNTNPPPRDEASFAAKAHHVSPLAHVDFALTAFVGADSAPEDLAGVLAQGAVGWNAFNGVTIYGVAPAADDLLLALLTSVARHQTPFGVLVEDQAMVAAARRAHAGDTWTAWTMSRTPEAEFEAIVGMLALAEATKAHVHVNHLSLGAGLQRIAAARRRGVRVTCETTPHYLLVSRDHVQQKTALSPVSPPLRSEHDGALLWAGLRSGAVDILTSDHAPHPSSALSREDPWGPPVTGFSGIELTVPLMLDAARRGLLSLSQLARAFSEAPARLFGLHPRKGSLEVGADADLTFVDLGLRRTVDPARLHSRGVLTPFAGWELTGWPVMTMLRGRMIASDGELLSQPGQGEMLRPASVA